MSERLVTAQVRLAPGSRPLVLAQTWSNAGHLRASSGKMQKAGDFPGPAALALPVDPSLLHTSLSASELGFLG